MATLYLELGGVLYTVTTGAPGTWTLLALPGGKRPGASYTVSDHGCSCPDAVFRSGRACKHRVCLGSVGLLPAVAETVV